jgi:PTS system nitrogen regulatory IIA component
MKLNVSEAANLLQVSERTIHRWIDILGLPSTPGSKGPEFQRNELIEWADAHSFHLAKEVPGEKDAAPPSIQKALFQGGIHHKVPGISVEECLEQVSQLLVLPDPIDRVFFHHVLLAREDLASTGIGEGIAIPHVRAPLVLHVEAPTLGLFFLETPIDWGAIDHKPVDTLFALVSPGVRQHLGLLSRISFAVRDPDFHSLIQNRAPAETLLKAAGAIDEKLVQR